MGYDQFRHARRVDADVISFHLNDMTKLFTAKRPVSTYVKLSTGSTNNFLLDGASGIYIAEGGTACMHLHKSGTDDIVEGRTANAELYLQPNGTGVVKFGTHTATGDVVSNGSIEIKDAGGTTRKLMTKA